MCRAGHKTTHSLTLFVQLPALKAAVELLFVVDNRALTICRIWQRDGVLAVSCAQEGLVRLAPYSKL